MDFSFDENCSDKKQIIRTGRYAPDSGTLPHLRCQQFFELGLHSLLSWVAEAAKLLVSNICLIDSPYDL